MHRGSDWVPNNIGAKLETRLESDVPFFLFTFFVSIFYP